MPSSIAFGLLELPFLIICIVFAFLTSKQMKGGKFGKGMNLMAWGFLVMAIGHLNMQLHGMFHFNLIHFIFGDTVGPYAWYAALMLTWTLSGLGFYNMYKTSKGN